MTSPLSSRAEYEALIYSLPDRYPSIRRSTLVYIPSASLFGRVEGMLIFEGGIVLCVQEFLNFELRVVEGYGYEVSRAQVSLDDPEAPIAAEYCSVSYPYKEKLYWYDSFPHPSDPSLAATHPHHKHLPPDIKHHRAPAADLSFTVPNLPFLIREIERILLT